MKELQPEQQRIIRAAFREIYAQFCDKTEELFSLHRNGISGLVEKINNPAYDLNTGNSEPEFVDDFLSFYQTEGVQFLLDHERVLIADEMGGGKTAQAIASKLALENRLGRKVSTLIMCPNEQIKLQWERHLKGYTDNHGRYHPGYIDKDRLKQMSIENITDYSSAKVLGADIVLIDYHALSFSEKSENHLLRKELKKKLLDAGFEYVILDEAHNVKNYSSASRFKNVHDIAAKSKYLCLLSGTILPNSLKDIYSAIALLKPESLDENGNKTGYKDASAVAEAHARYPAVLGAILRSSRLQRRLEEIRKMPPKIEEYIHIEGLEGKQREAYEAVYEDNSLLGLQKIHRLKQALLDPALIDSSFAGGPKAKFDALDSLVEEAVKKGEKIVIYSPNYREGVVDVLEQRYQNFGAVHMDGQNRAARDSIIKRFQKDPSAKVLVMNKVGGEGIALTAANNIVFLEEPYSPGERKQVIGRLWRPGQTKPVRVMTLNVQGTIDDGVREFLEQKKVAIDYVEKGIPLTPEQKLLISGDNDKALARWLSISHEHLYTPSQITSILIGNAIEKPEDKVVDRLNDKFGKHLADSLNKSWNGSVLSNCAQIYTAIFNGIESTQGKCNRVVDIASGFGALSHSLGRRGIHNVDADKYHFESAHASSDNINLVGRMTQLPIKENGSFDFALCSMGLDILPNCEAEPARVKAVAEANRILKTGGYYVITLPGPSVPADDSGIKETIEQSGFEVIPQLTGFIRSKDRQIGTNIYVLTAKKAQDIPGDFNPVGLIQKFNLNSRKDAKKKGVTQRRSGITKEFEFIRADGSLEDLVNAVEIFKSLERK